MSVQGVTNSPPSFFQRNLSGIVATTALVTAVALGSLLALGLMHGNPLCLTSLAHKALVIGAPIGMGTASLILLHKLNKSPFSAKEEHERRQILIRQPSFIKWESTRGKREAAIGSQPHNMEEEPQHKLNEWETLLTEDKTDYLFITTQEQGAWSQTQRSSVTSYQKMENDRYQRCLYPFRDNQHKAPPLGNDCRLNQGSHMPLPGPGLHYGIT